MHDRTDILKLVPKDSRVVLDIGCGVGVLGRRLKESGMRVVGIEKDPESCKEAERLLDRVICCDAENAELDMEDKSFDCVIFGDILEHIYDPQAVLKKYKRYMKDEGVVIASIPNVRYYKIIIRLICGTWDYMDSGMLDFSHLRFFGLVNIKEMFSEAGFDISFIGRNIVASRGFRFLNLIFLNSLRNFLTYQYYIVVRKSLAGKPALKNRKKYKF